MKFAFQYHSPCDLKHIAVASPFDIDDLEIGKCSIKVLSFTFLGDFGQALLIRSCHEDVILTRKSHNCAGTAFVQEDSKLIDKTLPIVMVMH